MEELMAIIEKANEDRVVARLAGDVEESNRLSIVIAEAECALKSLTG
jgi:hypothetical protein